MFLIGNIQGRYFEHLDCLLTEDTLVQKYIELPFLGMWSGIPKYAESYQDTNWALNLGGFSDIKNSFLKYE